MLGLVACGPTIALEPEVTTGGEDSSTSAPDESGPPAPVTVTTPPMPGDTTDGPLDTGSPDTGEPWLDLPEDCSIFEQNCPPGFKCMPYANDGGNSWNDTQCVPLVPDPGAPGDPCTILGSGLDGLDDCDGTSMCWDVDLETNMGTCAAFCVGSPEDPSCAESCHYCTISGDGVLTLCLESCDPVAQDCPLGQACYAANEVFTCIPDASPEDAVIGSPCEFINACPPGSLCVNGDSVPGCEENIGCCSPVCPAGGADPCPGLLPGTECVPWYGDEPPPPSQCGVSDPGVCIIP